jgi:hypothetical protein
MDGMGTLSPTFLESVSVSPLGHAIVTAGAIRHALDSVEQNALELKLA